MIHVERSLAPVSINSNEQAWTSELCLELTKYHLQLAGNHGLGITKPPKPPRARKEYYASASIKAALKKMLGNKCCYCEAKVTVVSYLNVAHFRPQSTYPALAYKWTNLLFACERCNSAHKRDRFPIAPNGNHAVVDPNAPCLLDDSDESILIDPCTDNPEDHFHYNFYEKIDNDFIDVVLVSKSERAKATRSIYGLDRPDLVDDRRLHLRDVQSRLDEYLLAKYAENKVLERQYSRAIIAMCTSAGQYSAMTIAYVSWKMGTNFDLT
jgi:uncharacterized protein (TIGR02646 family)